MPARPTDAGPAPVAAGAVSPRRRRARRSTVWAAALAVAAGGTALAAFAQFEPPAARALPAAGALPAAAAVVHPDVARSLAGPPGEPISVVVHVRLPSAASSAVQSSGTRVSPPRHRAGYVAAVRRRFATSASELLAELETERAIGRVARFEPLWLADAVAVSAVPAAVAELAGRPDVRWITPDPVLVVDPWIPEAWSTHRTPAVAPRDPAAGATARDDVDAPPLWNVEMVRADAVWDRLGYDGSGVTVAILDTGVDFHHPLLKTRYRGYAGEGLPDNHGNWWCSGDDSLCGLGSRYPVDNTGHGTHVAGSAVAGDGIGVAPGARWIAARVCVGRDCPFSAVAGGIQWLLDRAPESQPDVLNFSLGTTSEIEISLLRPIFNRLYAAGLVVVAASGNHTDLLQAPASFTSTIAVGAVTDAGEVWIDSARGVSTWGEAKPDVVAPGTGITSTVPGGGVWRSTGTSMATPHVSGVVALLLEARPDLGPGEVKSVLAATARPVKGSSDDAGDGAGLVDAYAAVASVTDVGSVHGRVTRAADGGPIAWAHVIVADEVGAQLADVAVDPADGSYAIDLEPGRYLLIARAFGFRSEPQRVTIQEKVGTRLDFSLAFDEPMGVFQGRLVDARTGAPLAGELHLADVPFTLPSDENFGFSQRLPPQTYLVRIERFGYRVRTDVVKINPGETVTRVYALEATPKILLVDGDAWTYGGAIDPFHASLTRLGFVYHTWRVTHPQAGPGKPGGPPTTAELAAYDVVIWSSPLSSPNSVKGAWELNGYLELGGRLLLTGQDALCYDAGRDTGAFPCEANAAPHPYVTQKLKVRVTNDRAVERVVDGRDGGPLEGITLTLNGPGSLDNQATPDKLAVTDPLAASVIATYDDGRGAAVLAGTCEPYRAIALGFGFEGIAGAEARDAVLTRLVDALVARPPARALHLMPETTGLSRRPGATADYTVTLTSTGLERTEFDISVDGAVWPTEVWEGGLTRPLAGPLVLGPCDRVPFVVRVRVPEGTPRGAADVARVRVTARASDAHAELALRTRTPAPVLVVDGDYARQSEARYLEALDASGVAFDVHELGLFNLYPTMPTTRTLADYPAVVWFTGYDVLRPNGSLDRAGQRALDAYLGAGGRLLLSSEDFLRHWGQTPYRDTTLFHQAFLGVGAYVDDGGSAHAGPLAGEAGSVLEGLGDCRLPSRPADADFSDRLTPSGGLARVALRDPYGGPVATQFEAAGAFRTLFLAFDAGGLDAPCANALVARAMDWFSPLNPSTLMLVDAAGLPEARGAFAAGETVRLRLRATNGGPRAVDVATLRWVLPEGAALDPATLPPAWAWDAGARTLAWQGPLARFATVDATVALVLADDLPDATAMTSSVVLNADGIPITRESAWRVNAGDLGGSSKSVPDAERIRRHGEAARFIVNVVNRGTRPVAAFRVTDTLPAGLVLEPASVTVEGGTVDLATPGTIVWQGPELAPGRTASLTYRARVTTWNGGWLRNRALLTGPDGERHPLEAAVFARPLLVFPWLGRQLDPDP